MAKKIYLYDTYGFEFYSCEFEGLDAEGKPRLTLMTPGCPVENFLEHLDVCDESATDYNLLCEDGQQADSKLIVEMLGQIFLNANNPYARMSARLEDLRRYGIAYDQNVQKLSVEIFEYKDEESATVYRLMMYIGEKRRYIGESDHVGDICDIFVKLRGFFYFMESQVHIPLKKHLEVSESQKKLVKRIVTDMFDEIEID